MPVVPPQTIRCSSGSCNLANRLSPLLLVSMAKNLDHLVSLLEHHNRSFAIMHCVAIYPTPSDQLKLSQIDFLRTHYRGVPIGFSTHESPEALTPIVAAVAKGATLYERHVGIGTDNYKLNAYSSTPAQLQSWFEAWRAAVAMCGGARRSPARPEEIESLTSLKRGVFARRPLQVGEELDSTNVILRCPCLRAS